MIILALVFALFFDSIPSGWIALKDERKACQIGAPGDFKMVPYLAYLGHAPDDTVQVAVLSSRSPVKPIGESEGKMMKIEKFVDNSVTRVFYRSKQVKLKDGRKFTQWTVKVPRTFGSCSATIVVIPDGHEDLVKKIAATIGPAD
jgi:hypothetical protein